MADSGDLFDYIIRLADSDLLLGQRLCELVGSAPALEEEMALANIGLDLLGRATLLLDYAAEIEGAIAGRVEGAGRDADDLAFTRDTADFRSLLLVEQPNGDFAHVIGRIHLYSSFRRLLFSGLSDGSDRRIAEIARKALKEVAYHERHAGEWVVRLGDGTEESHARMQSAIDALWPFTGEMSAMDDLERRLHAEGIAVDTEALRGAWRERVTALLARATLTMPEDGFMHAGGKDGGMHSEYLGYMLAEMQFLRRAYPDARAW